MAATEVKRIKRGGVFMKLFASCLCMWEALAKGVMIGAVKE